jgi:hypothetical protein
MDQLNTAVALQSSFWPALVERGLLLGAAGEWEQARESAARALVEEPGNVSGGWRVCYVRVVAVCCCRA